MSSPPIIIIVEPDPMVSSVLRVEFTRLNFAVLLAADGAEAEDYASRALAHLVIMDAGRRDLRAYEACARIRRRAGYAKRPIVLSANSLTDTVKGAAAMAGATALLSKPYSVGDLFAAVTPHVPADDPLLTARQKGSGMPETQLDWTALPNRAPPSGTDSALAGNGRILTIVRAQGQRMPLLRQP